MVVELGPVPLQLLVPALFSSETPWTKLTLGWRVGWHWTKFIKQYHDDHAFLSKTGDSSKPFLRLSTEAKTEIRSPCTTPGDLPMSDRRDVVARSAVPGTATAEVATAGRWQIALHLNSFGRILLAKFFNISSSWCLRGKLKYLNSEGMTRFYVGGNAILKVGDGLYKCALTRRSTCRFELEFMMKSGLNWFQGWSHTKARNFNCQHSKGQFFETQWRSGAIL